MRMLPVSFLLSCIVAGALVAQQAPTDNVVLIVIDGVRWQEVFRGVEAGLLTRTDGGVGDTACLRSAFWRDDVDGRRTALMPWLWSKVGEGAFITGDGDSLGTMSLTNTHRFSYPGYSEMLVGFADPSIDSNDDPPNPNVTVFEWVAGTPGFAGRVAAFGTWDAFPRIFNRGRAGFPVVAGWEPPFDSATPGTPEALLNDLYRTIYREWDDVAWDALMQQAVLRTVPERHPRLLFVGFGETDTWAHGRHYDRYLSSLHAVDSMIGNLWDAMQAMPGYRGRTTFVITADHGRGNGREWTDHGAEVSGAERVWMAIVGSGAPPNGPGSVTQSQIAATVAALLGLNWTEAEPRAAAPVTH